MAFVQSAQGFDFELQSIKGDDRSVVITVSEAPRPPLRVTTSVRAGRGASPRPSSPLRESTIPEPPSRTASPVQESALRSHTSSPTLVRSGSIVSTGTHSPVMRSMFPRFDPGVPLAQQNYYPSMDRAPPPPPAMQPWEPTDGTHYSPSLYSQPGNPSLGGRDSWGRVNPLPLNSPKSPLQLSEASPANLSSPEDLLDVWDLANGQTHEVAEIYILGLHCIDLTPNQETIALTSSHTPLYTLQAASSALTITRSHPTNPNPTITILTPTISKPSATSPLIATLFPKLAELMAVDQSSTIALAHHLSRTDSADLQSEAVSRTHDTEAASLLWDSDSSAYYLSHPSLSSGESTTLPIEHDTSTNTMRILAPTSSKPLLTLNLATKTMTLSAPTITALPSFYILDILISALLTLLLHLHRQSALPLSQPLPSPTLTFAPPPKSPHRASLLNPTKPSRAARSLRSKLHLTTSSPSANEALDIEKALSTASTVTVTEMRTKTISPALRTQGVDLSHFQSYDLEDPRLGAGTKAALRVVYWVFGVLVWVLGVVVGVVAAGVVAVGRLGGRVH